MVDKAAGRVPVVAGGIETIHPHLSFISTLATFEGGLNEQAQLMNDMGKIASAVVIITNQIAAMEDVGKNCTKEKRIIKMSLISFRVMKCGCPMHKSC